MMNLEIRHDSLDAAEAALAPNQPVFMLNLLRYRDQAFYADGGASPCTGREAFHERYSPAFRRLAAGRSVQRLFAGSVMAKLVAPQGAQWHVVAINEYADFATFRAIVDTPEYRRDIEPHRLAALEDFRLFALDRLM